MSERPLILMSGLIGTGKSTTAKEIVKRTGDYVILNSSKTRRILGFDTYKKEDGPLVRAHIEKEAEKLLSMGKSIILDSINNTYAHRREDYDFANKMGLEALMVETSCSPVLAKSRIKSRAYLELDVHVKDDHLSSINGKTKIQIGDSGYVLHHFGPLPAGKFADTSDPAEYDRVLRQRESFDKDLLRHPDMTYVKMDTESNYADVVKVKKEILPFVNSLIVLLGYSIKDNQLVETA